MPHGLGGRVMSSTPGYILCSALKREVVLTHVVQR